MTAHPLVSLPFLKFFQPIASCLSYVRLISVVLSPRPLNMAGLVDGLVCDSVLLLIGCCLIPVEELRVRDNLPPMVDRFTAMRLALGIATTLTGMAAALLLDDSALVARLVRYPAPGPTTLIVLRPSLLMLHH